MTERTTTAPKLTNRPDVAQMTSVHRTFDTRIFSKISRSLANSGRSVLLITQHDRNEYVDKVHICGVSSSETRRARIFSTSYRVASEAIASGARICHFHDPELIPAGLLLKLLGRKVIYDVHEDYPRTIETKDWIPAHLRWPMAQVVRGGEWLTALCVDQIFAATPSIAKRFPLRKTTLLQNFPIQDEFSTQQWPAYASRPNNVAYVGDVTSIRGAIQMVQAVGLVDSRTNARLKLAGNITPSSLLEEMKRTEGWDRVIPLGFCDRHRVREMFSEAKVGLVLFQAHPNHINAQPNKLFEYMSAGLPVIASDFPLWREIVDGAGAGLLVNPMDPSAIAKGIEWIFTHTKEAEEMGKRGLEAIRSKYNWEEEEKKLIVTYDRLSGSIFSRHVL
jgi:glycosyltransferase involved in cell wall biosynthesis